MNALHASVRLFGALRIKWILALLLLVGPLLALMYVAL